MQNWKVNPQMVVSVVRELALQNYDRGNGKGNKYKWKQARTLTQTNPVSWWYVPETPVLGSLGQLYSEFKTPNY